MIETFDQLAQHMIIKGLNYRILYLDSQEREQMVTGWVSYISDNLIGVVGQDMRHYRLKRDNIIAFTYLGKFNVINGVQQENKIIIGETNNEISNNRKN